MNKDWTGNSNSIYKTLGASNHTDKDRQNEDYYATEPKAAKLLLGLETFSPNIWECACGEGHLSKIFTEISPSWLVIFTAPLICRNMAGLPRRIIKVYIYF